MGKGTVVGGALLVLVFGLVGPVFSSGDRLSIPSIPDTLRPFVQQVLSSQPGDVFVVLKNGLTVLVHPKLQNDVVSAQVLVRAGLIYEGKYRGSGISHYLEHVLSGGSTRSFTEAQAKERLQAIGGESNAFTSYDRTGYYINSSSKHWKDSLDLLLSYVTESILDPQEVAREKSVIQQEIKMGENNPGSELWKLYMNTAYRNSPVRDPIIGYEEVFLKLDRDALEDYYSRRYHPENMVVVVSGRVDPWKVIEFVYTKTKDFRRKVETALPGTTEPPQVSPRRQERELPIVRLTQAILGFPSVDLHHPDLYALDVLALLLGQGESCNLVCRLKDRENQVLSVSATNWTPSYVHGQFMVNVTLPPQNWPQAISIIHDEMDRFKREPVKPKELEKAKKSIIAQHICGKESSHARGSSLAVSYLETGDPYFEETYVDGIRRVTAEEVRRVARRYLDRGRMNVAATHPPGGEKAAQSAPVAPATAADDPPVRFAELPNGLRTLLKRDASLPRVTIQLYGLGGLSLEGSQRPGISAFTASLLTAGTGKRNKMDILRAIEDVGGTIESKSDNNSYHIAVKVLKEDLDVALDIVADLVRNARFPESEIEKKRTETLMALRRLDENWQSEVLRLFKRNYFQQSSYGQDRLGTEESVGSFSRREILSFYRKMVNPRHSVLAVYGDLDVEKTSRTVREKFQGWRGVQATLPPWPDETRPLTADRLVEKKNEKTSAALFIGTNGLAVDSEDRPILDVLDAVLSGRGSPCGRLFDALRGKEDLVYVVSGFPFYGRKAGYFGVLTQTTPSNLEKVQEIVLENLRKMAREPISPEDLQSAKDTIHTSQALQMESLDAQARTAALNEVLGLGWDHEDRYMQRVQAVTAEEVQQLARELFSNTLIVRTIPQAAGETPPSTARLK